MAKVIGLGGIFFKSRDPEKLGEWYKRWLGVPVDPPWGAVMKLETMPPESYSVWSPFKATTDYFNPSVKEFMVNMVVDDLEGALSQVSEGGAQVDGEIEDSEYGRFGWFMDPEGNKVELWEPKAG